jgi:hypothetical protein
MAFLARLVGPLLARELLRLARGPTLRLVVVAAPMFLLLLMLAEGRTRWVESTSAQAAEAISSFVGQTFLIGGVVLALTLPLWICPTIVRERNEGGFDLILTTQLSIVEVLQGVAGAAVAVSALVAASIAPVISMMALFGGVDFFYVAACLFTIGLEVVCLTGGCLQAAAAHRTPIRATLIGAGQGLGAFIILAMIATPALNGIGRLESPFFAKAATFAVLAAVFLTIAGGMFAVWLQSATAAFANSDHEFQRARPRQAKAEASERDAPDVKRSAMWGPLKLRLDDSSPTRLQIRAVWVLYLGLGMPFCWLIRTGQGATVAPLLLVIWIAIQPFVIVVAATNPLLSRRPGFFDDLLTTNLPNKEILTGVMWIVQPALIRLLAAPVGLALLWFALNPAGNLVGTIIGAAWTAELVIVGAILSLADNRLSMRLLGILFFWGGSAVAPVVAKVLPYAEMEVLLYAAPGTLAVGWLLQRRATWGRMLGFCLLVHAAIASVGGWLGGILLAKPPVDPVSMVTPLYWMGHCLWEVARDWQDPLAPMVKWSILPAIPFAIALVAAVSFFWRYAWWRFDQLVGRTHR